MRAWPRPLCFQALFGLLLACSPKATPIDEDGDGHSQSDCDDNCNGAIDRV